MGQLVDNLEKVIHGEGHSRHNTCEKRDQYIKDRVAVGVLGRAPWEDDYLEKKLLDGKDFFLDDRDCPLSLGLAKRKPIDIFNYETYEIADIINEVFSF